MEPSFAVFLVRFDADVLSALLIRLVNDPVAAKYDLPFVQQFNTGAAPLAKEIIDKLAKRFPHIRIRQAWGMTESCSALTLTPPADQTYDRAHTVGKVVPETVIKIIDPEYTGEGEKILGIGQSGEVLAKGPQVTMGYYNRPEATAETYDKDGFLHTGDIGFMDQDGFLMIHDRLKEMIKVKGVGVAPAELEDLLLGHPLVTDTAVIGVPDDYAGEVPKAFVVLADSSKANSDTTKTLLEFVKQRKSRPKWLAGGIEFVSAVPKSASGKVLRRVLRDQEKERAKQKKRATTAKL
jgi:acyl-CoA synthetase (AMP-forming)/AMP-acid ligase II